MDKALHLVNNSIGSGRGVAKRLFIDLNQRPEEEETYDQPKVVGQSLVAADNSLRYHWDKNEDNALAIIRDRKVKLLSYPYAKENDFS
ncbi:hypothetical protein L1987_86351 [Smallanthus sonchifolius]|uniref:Uncharacterized protein n=4 Tax=Smallanthus sonchifolius TaxID=185202 RepID=A0ACB8XYH8_9ASTR|nr:hypothetical protein L1987_86335 [Smallanthus sonchifolius]KAI3676727.1 hypothetical protein L1987_86340 [Smallanthus sonchifolius]KAI3676732.1 hypothetical protein L1987_86345 [Smallanthus sonchifolius]KAI3676738.1 hypothetical protein L1987_86351 [Smallanthus sonchifolius]